MKNSSNCRKLKLRFQWDDEIGVEGGIVNEVVVERLEAREAASEDN